METKAITSGQKAEIRRLRQEGKLVKEIIEIVGCGKSSVCKYSYEEQEKQGETKICMICQKELPISSSFYVATNRMGKKYPRSCCKTCYYNAKPRKQRNRCKATTATTPDVIQQQIKNLYNKGLSFDEIAKITKVSKSSVSRYKGEKVRDTRVQIECSKCGIKKPSVKNGVCLSCRNQQTPKTKNITLDLKKMLIESGKPQKITYSQDKNIDNKYFIK